MKDGKITWGKLVSPKQTESQDGVPERLDKTLPSGAVKKS